MTNGRTICGEDVGDASREDFDEFEDYEF